MSKTKKIELNNIIASVFVVGDARKPQNLSLRRQVLKVLIIKILL